MKVQAKVHVKDVETYLTALQSLSRTRMRGDSRALTNKEKRREERDKKKGRREKERYKKGNEGPFGLGFQGVF